MSPAFSPFVIILPNFHLICIPGQPWSLLCLIVVWLHLFWCSAFHHFVSDNKIPSWVSFCQPRQVKSFALTLVRQNLSLCSFSVSGLNLLFLKMSGSYFAQYVRNGLILSKILESCIEEMILILSASVGIIFIFTSWSNICPLCGCIRNTCHQLLQIFLLIFSW